MPELPEVETVVRTLRPRVVGATLRGVILHRADILSPKDLDLSACVIGRSVVALDRRGKRIIFTLDDGCRFFVHLGMTGRLTASDPAIPCAPHTHLELDLSDTRIRFSDPRRFGGVWWLGDSTPPDEGMGPEPLTLRSRQLAPRLARTARAIKVVLLDQAIIAGLGNIYVDESLFLARIHPLRPSKSLSAAEIGRLSRAIKATLRRAIHHRGSTLRDYRDADGNAGDFQSRHRVYDRANQPCRRCRTPILRIVIGGRSTHFCPICQAGDPPSAEQSPRKIGVERK